MRTNLQHKATPFCIQKEPQRWYDQNGGSIAPRSLVLDPIAKETVYKKHTQKRKTHFRDGGGRRGEMTAAPATSKARAWRTTAGAGGCRGAIYAASPETKHGVMYTALMQMRAAGILLVYAPTVAAHFIPHGIHARHALHVARVAR